MRNIEHLHKIKQAIRDVYAWPGGYPLYLVTMDGEALSIKAARENFAYICRAYISDDSFWNDWRIYGIEINFEDDSLYCCHSGEKIESAYCD